jgi:hypothetical protein
VIGGQWQLSPSEGLCPLGHKDVISRERQQYLSSTEVVE